ncbi:CBL-interacting serine/threonine-protein kinase 14 [Cajanus cajan]|uniref:non-specific serine/threonine protein kinase n=1 Tax=Cajanus cajan TaxID=3821 RepID=A0A151S0X3_CAJCA|nr:CBL-interacting serine/threonine-protein kinase 14 [Cajanus cajan]KYP48394.1 CBL-interacting serine/threonine-protein kinase 11 [Cajanus cajan]
MLHQGATSTTKDEAVIGVVLFGKYEILKLLGVGGSAKVYHARNVHTAQSVAVKAVSKRTLERNGYAAHVEREVAIMRRLRHPHTVRLYEVLATKSKIYFVMEFIAGGELFHVVAGEGRLTEDTSRRYFRQLVSAVRHCHSRGVFHRDLKLDNLLVDGDTNLKVSDFGLGALRSQIRHDGMLHTVCGTPAYVAPEILARKGYHGASVDAWSCGVVLFALNAGYLPFNDSNITVLYRKIYRGQFRFPRWMSSELRNLVTRLLDTNPDTRITLDEVTRDPWFNRGGYSDTITRPEEWGETRVVTKCLNAFDLISFSFADMSGLFSDPEYSDFTERFVTREVPESVMVAVREVAVTVTENVTATKDESGCGGVRIEGLDGNFVVMVGFYRLTDELVMVEVKRRERKEGSGERFWRDVLRPLLLALAHYPVSR